MLSVGLLLTTTRAWNPDGAAVPADMTLHAEKRKINRQMKTVNSLSGTRNRVDYG